MKERLTCPKMEQTKNEPSYMKKSDPLYIDATIRQLPSLDDPRERRIIDVMKEKLLVTPWARETVSKLRELVLANWQEAFSNLDRPEYVHDITQKGVKEAAAMVNSKIVSGKENLEELEKGSSVMVISNHFGTFKLISMNPEELKQRGVIGHKVPNVYYPYLTYYMPFHPIGEVLGDNVYEGSFEEPGRLGDLFRATGSVDVPPPDVFNAPQERTEALVKMTKELFDKHNNAALVIFPEGGTTGKRSGGAIYDLEEFKTGAFIIAAQLGVPILPVGQYFNVDSGFELGVFKPFSLQPNQPKEYYKEAANKSRVEMQTWLSHRQQLAVSR